MKKILIIEDQIDAQEMLIARYQEENVKIDLAETGVEAFYYINHYDYNTIIVSNDLSDLDGLWIIQHLKKLQHYELILTSKYNHERLEKEADRLKVRYLRKPLEKMIKRSKKM